MIKLLIIALSLIPGLLPAGISAVEIDTYTVDGVFNNKNVVIYRRQPIFSFDYSGTISSFTITVGTATDTEKKYVLETSTLWVIHTTTSPSADVSFLILGENKFRTSIKYGGQPLKLNTTYYWSLIVYDISGSSTTKLGEFYTVVSSVAVNFTNYDLQIDFNNPFNPYNGQKTKFRYFLEGKNEIKKKVKIRIYTLTGEYVNTAVHSAPLSDDPNWYEALPGRVYTAEWDGTDIYGKIVEPGIYLVNLAVENESKGITRIVIVKRD